MRFLDRKEALWRGCRKMIEIVDLKWQDENYHPALKMLQYNDKKMASTRKKNVYG